MNDELTSTINEPPSPSSNYLHQSMMTEFLLAIISIVSAVIISTAIYLTNIEKIHPNLAPFVTYLDLAKPVSLLGNEFRPVGNLKGGFQGNSSIVNQLDNGELVLSKRVHIKARNFPFIEYQLSPLHPGLSVHLFWRNSDEPDKLHSVQLPLSTLKSNMANLSNEAGWAGTIVELTIFAQGDLRDTTFDLKQLTLLPATSGNILKQIASDALSLRVWTQASINAIKLGPTNTIMSPVLAISVWVALSIVMFMLLKWASTSFKCTPGSNQVLSFSGAVFLIGWIALDLLWTRRLLFQAEETNYLFAGKSMQDKKLADIDGGIYKDVSLLMGQLGKPGPRIWIVTKGISTFVGYRIKYHLTGYPTYYYRNDTYLYTLLQLAGPIARKGDIFIFSSPHPHPLGYEFSNGTLRLISLCAPATSLYQSDLLLAIQIESELEQC